MPSPFPGMDPYLENVLYWKSVHHDLISLITFQLNESLPEPFLARSEGRSYILPRHELIYPDAIVVRAPSADAADLKRGKIAAATATRTDSPPLLFEFSEREVYEPHVEIFSVEDEQVVAVIEVLSPTNKSQESTGREEYVKKQKQILNSSTHLVEIDLLRGGLHTVAVARETIRARKNFDYVVCLRRADETRTRFEVWAFTVRESLPTVRIPLTEGWADFDLDLQAIWGEAYRLGRWAKAIQYGEESDPPLSPADTAWADALFREKGLRP